MSFWFLVRQTSPHTEEARPYNPQGTKPPWCDCEVTRSRTGELGTTNTITLTRFLCHVEGCKGRGTGSTRNLLPAFDGNVLKL